MHGNLADQVLQHELDGRESAHVTIHPFQLPRWRIKGPIQNTANDHSLQTAVATKMQGYSESMQRAGRRRS